MRNLHDAAIITYLYQQLIQEEILQKKINIRLVPIKNSYNNSDYDDLEERISDLESKIENLE